MFTFRKNYFLLTTALFCIEVLIALYVTDRIVRPYVGDYLVVIMLYCFVRAFTKMHVLPAAISVLVFAYIIEWMQYLNLVAFLGWQDSKLANTILGYHFEWIDMLAYTLGIVTVWLVERNRSRTPSIPPAGTP